MSGVKIGGVALLGGGFLFLWSGYHGAHLTGSLRDLLAGKQPDPNPASDLAINGLPSVGSGGDALGSSGGGDSGGGSGGSVASGSNQKLGQRLAAAYGWGSGAQWAALVNLWNRESGWSNTAQNPTSGAYGIPQALPYTKMPKAAWPPSAGGSADPSAQILWGLSYISGRYGDPVSAWAHEQSAGWY